MKNQISFFAIIAFVLSSIFVIGQTRDVGNFNAVHASTSVVVTLVKASSPSVEFTMKKGNPEQLITKVKNGTLYVKMKSGSDNWNNTTKADVTVYYTELDAIKASAGCTLTSDNTIKAREMDIGISSGSTAKLDIEATDVEVEVSSGATLILKGEAKKGNFEASSGATLNAYYFVTQDADVEANSGASLSIHVDDTLDAEASSGASISYTGDVKNKNIDAGWSGRIKRKGR